MNESPEFVSEAQEIIETFSRQLLEIEGQIRDEDEYDPDLLNGAFRSVHTLKGLSSLSGVNEIVELSHGLENTLDALRLGKLPLDQRTLDLLFESVELFGKLLATVADPDSASNIEVSAFLERVAELSKPRRTKTEDPLAWLDDSILGSRPGDTSYPLRMFFGTLGDELADFVARRKAEGGAPTDF